MANYVKDDADRKKQEKAWKRGGLRFMLALLVKEFGLAKVKNDLLIIEKDDAVTRIMKEL
jgi:hypothetical protein